MLTKAKTAQEILGDRFEMHTAFSRQTSEKVYVQHLLSKHASEILPLLLDHHAYLYICGDSRMAREVQHTLQELIGSLSQVDGEQFLRSLKESGRFQVSTLSLIATHFASDGLPVCSCF